MSLDLKKITKNDIIEKLDGQFNNGDNTNLAPSEVEVSICPSSNGTSPASTSLGGKIYSDKKEKGIIIITGYNFIENQTYLQSAFDDLFKILLK